MVLNKKDLKNPSLYVNRQLSTIGFNQRVLGETLNKNHPLLERAKYLAIYGSNMDEFFMVRVSGLKQQLSLGIVDKPADGLTPREQLVAIHRTVTELVDEQMKYWHLIRSELEAEQIYIREYKDLKASKQAKLRTYFDQEIFPVLTPLSFDPSHPFPHISNLSLNLAVVIRDPQTNEIRFARVKVPNTLPRLVPLQRVAPDNLLSNPSQSQKFVWLEHVITANLDRLFPGMEIVDAHPFRITRNNDMEIQEEEADDLLLSIEESLRQRFFGKVVRLEVDHTMPADMLEMLVTNFGVSSYEIYVLKGPLDLTSLWGLMRLERPELLDKPHHPKLHPSLQTGESIFRVLRRKDILLHRPYDNFSQVVKFIETAASDPKVLTIKMTLYRVGSNPALVNALMKARENGKQVAVLVELKARFDEKSNISWARALEKAGVHVVYGLIGFKTHAKIALVIRREKDGLRRYIHLSTGNYNASTAKIYTDLDLLTSDTDLGADATDIFNLLTGFSNQKKYRKMLVAPTTLRPELHRMIQEEAQHGSKGRIILKCNSLVDIPLIQELYKASQAGVKIDLIIRGICCLRPGIPGISETIRVVSIVGRFLEHPRIFYFENKGDRHLYVGSADIMPRNLDRRVECVFPIENKELQDEIIHQLLEIQLADTQQAYEMNADGSYSRISLRQPEGTKLFDSQKYLLKKR